MNCLEHSICISLVNITNIILQRSEVLCKFDYRELFWPIFYLLDNKQVEEAAKRVEKEKELAKVSIRKEDVDLIADEMEISKSKAERTLCEHAGNVVEALAVLTNWIE